MYVGGVKVCGLFRLELFSCMKKYKMWLLLSAEVGLINYVCTEYMCVYLLKAE